MFKFKYISSLINSLQIYFIYVKQSKFQKNNLGSITLNDAAGTLLLDYNDYLLAKNYSKRTRLVYCREVHYLLAYFDSIAPASLTQKHLIEYLNFIKREHGVGRNKCRIAVSAFNIFFRQVVQSSLVAPNDLYPRGEFKLPEVMSQEQVHKLLTLSGANVKHQAIVSLLYGSGIRLGELQMLKLIDIDSKNFQLKIVAGKGKRDRFALLPKHLIEPLRAYYKAYRPSVYLFEGQTKGKPMNDRSLQHAIHQLMIQAGYADKGFSAHTLRHSFATHMLDQGNDIHSIKELLGHSKIETTMVYLHLQQKKRAAICSPFDVLMHTGQ